MYSEYKLFITFINDIVRIRVGFTLNEVQFIDIFSLVFHTVCVLHDKSMLTLTSGNFSSMFSSRVFKFSFIFRAIICFKLIFVYGVR